MTLSEFKYFPELPQYLRFRIFTCISIEDFEEIKYVNKELYELCSGKLSEETICTYGSQITEHLYKERCSINFSSEICELKDETISWKEFYNRVIYLDDIDTNILFSYVTDGKLLELEIIAIKERTLIQEFSSEIAFIAAEKGHLHILKRLKEKLDYMPNIKNTNYIFQHGQLEVLKWLKENTNMSPTILDANAACHGNNIHILEWIKENG